MKGDGEGCPLRSVPKHKAACFIKSDAQGAFHAHVQENGNETSEEALMQEIVQLEMKASVLYGFRILNKLYAP